MPLHASAVFQEVWCWHRRLHCAALVYNAIIHRKQLIMHNKSGNLAAHWWKTGWLRTSARTTAQDMTPYSKALPRLST
jgi:hypothetical protein